MKSSLPFRGGEPPVGGGGVLLWNLLLDVKDLRKNPSVSLRLPAPFSREPE